MQLASRDTKQKKNISPSKSSTSQAMQFMDQREETILQKKAKQSIDQSPVVTVQQQKTAGMNSTPLVQKKENKTGMSDQLLAGVEHLSGLDMGDTRVHYNSPKPAQLNAHAYAQGTDIHIASGQEKHLAHEAWHVVQQKQGRVQPTRQMKGKTLINDDTGLEREADVMGAKAAYVGKDVTHTIQQRSISTASQRTVQPKVAQLALDDYDLDVIKNSGIDQNILDEIMEIYGDFSDHVNYGKVATGGGAQIIKEHPNVIVPKSLRRGFTKRGKSKNPQNSIEDTIRQSLIVHELVHEATAKSNNKGTFKGLDFSTLDSKLELAKIMTPQTDKDLIQSRMKSIEESLEEEKSTFFKFKHDFKKYGVHAGDLYNYIQMRIAYAHLSPPVLGKDYHYFEYPTVITELYYTLTKLEKGAFTGTKTYKKIAAAAKSAASMRRTHQELSKNLGDDPEYVD